VEVLLAGATAPAPPPLTDLVEPDLWDQLPADVSDLLTLLPGADLYLQDEVQIAFHPTLTRVWCRKGRRGQRLVEAPGDNRKVYGFGLVDWREGWFDGRIGPQRTADLFCEQLRAALARSQQRGRVALVLADNLRTHTPRGSLLVRRLLAAAHGQLRLVYTPAYDAEANRMEWLWRVVRPTVTHNHQREDFAMLLADLQTEFDTLAQHPTAVLTHIGSPFALDEEPTQPAARAA
jgi:transposase